MTERAALSHEQVDGLESDGLAWCDEARFSDLIHSLRVVRRELADFAVRWHQDRGHAGEFPGCTVDGCAPARRALGESAPNERTRYSDHVPGGASNYGWKVRFDDTGGTVGITQWLGVGIERVLLTRAQYAALADFVAPKKMRRKVSKP